MLEVRAVAVVQDSRHGPPGRGRPSTSSSPCCRAGLQAGGLHPVADGLLVADEDRRVERPLVEPEPAVVDGWSAGPTRDVRQLLLRRLLQGRRHRARVGPADQVRRRRRLRARRVAALPVGPRRRRGGHRPLDEGHRPAARADRPARQQGELLVDGRPRPRWAVLGDPLRPRPRVGPGLRRHDPRPRHALRARGPPAGDLEPGLHAGRALRGALQGGLRRRRLAAEEEHRHRHGPGPRRVPAPGQEQHVRDRRDVPRDREGRAAHRPPLRRRPRGRRTVPRRRRPRALLDDAHR